MKKRKAKKPQHENVHVWITLRFPYCWTRRICTCQADASETTYSWISFLEEPRMRQLPSFFWFLCCLISIHHQLRFSDLHIYFYLIKSTRAIRCNGYCRVNNLETFLYYLFHLGSNGDLRQHRRQPLSFHSQGEISCVHRCMLTLCLLRIKPFLRKEEWKMSKLLKRQTHSWMLQTSFTFIAMQYICYLFPEIKQYNR